MKEYISFINFTNMSDEEKYKLLNSKDYEIEKLNNIINKAIDYVNVNTLPNDEDYMFCMMLLDILKGVDKE